MLKFLLYFCTFVLLSNEISFIICEDGSTSTTEANFSVSLKKESEKLLFVVLSQVKSNLLSPREYLLEDLHNEADYLGWGYPKIFYTHRYLHPAGAWTIFPILKRIHEFAVANELSKWIVVCGEGTRVHLRRLVELLIKYDSSMDWFLGRGLRDNEPTIIHHFAFHENPSAFSYPNLASGFVLSYSLLEKLVKRVEVFVNRLEFSIDPSHEFAMFIRDEGRGVDLMEVREFCIEDLSWCATYYVSSTFPICGSPISYSDIFFAVKSCKQFENRVSVILQTWGNDNSLNIKFFTDSSNISYPRVNLEIPNTVSGHCAKTLGIINYAAKHFDSQKMSWLMIADDDTLVRLLKFLSCYDPAEAWAIGERYGFHTASGDGYDYITGGGGMVFSKEAVNQLSKPGACMCPSIDAPDDMVLGRCLEVVGIPITHTPHFHQARPMDYPKERLKLETPITFHKFWMINPVEVYQQWLQDYPSGGGHDEL